MTKIFTQPYTVRLFKPNSEEEEFGLAKTDFAVCPVCNCFYHHKAWHHDHIELQLRRSGNAKPLISRLCPACRMAHNREFEGEILLLNVPESATTQLWNLIRAFGARAYERDCQHRILEIRRPRPGVWRVTTTENQLAQKLARKIKSVFHKISLKISYSRIPYDVERVKMEFSARSY